MPLKMRDSVVQDYIPQQGGDGETDMDKQRMMQLFQPVQNEDGSWSVPTFGKQVFKDLEEAMNMVETYGVKDRTGIDKFLKSFKERKIGAMGTLSDFWNSTPEQQAAGMKVFNNLTGDFTDMFKSAPPPPANPYADPSLDIPFGSDGYIK
jgi:hypothetical protein